MHITTPIGATYLRQRQAQMKSAELVHITTPIGATYLRKRQAQMKSAELSTGTFKRPQGDAATASSTMPTTEETFVDLTVVVDPASDVEDVDPLVAPPF